jgi:hypothetical protein
MQAACDNATRGEVMVSRLFRKPILLDNFNAGGSSGQSTCDAPGDSVCSPF